MGLKDQDLVLRTSDLTKNRSPWFVCRGYSAGTSPLHRFYLGIRWIKV